MTHQKATMTMMRKFLITITWREITSVTPAMSHPVAHRLLTHIYQKTGRLLKYPIFLILLSVCKVVLGIYSTHGKQFLLMKIYYL